MAQSPVSNRQASLALREYFPLEGIYPSQSGSNNAGFYLGEIGIFAGNFVPAGGAGAGELLSINNNEAVFSLLGTTYGGNGVTNFALPDLRDRNMLGVGQGAGLPTEFLGEVSGSTEVTLSVPNTPPDNGGSSQPFDNHQPSLGITYEIAISGIFPSQGGNSSSLQLLGTVMPFASNFDPSGYVACEGQLLPIAQNQALFALLGTMYGGNGTTTFALPDLRGRNIVGASASTPIGTKIGQTAVALSNSQTPDGLGDPVQPFDNRQPGLAMNYLICVAGLFPSQGGGQDPETPFIGQIINFAGNFVPSGWALCDGSLIPIAQNTALFSLLGTTYGGNGKTTFALPDLRGRTVINVAPDAPLGTVLGSNDTTVTVDQLPSVIIRNAFPGGYALDPAKGILYIAASATVGGTGVTTSAAHPSIITNLGAVQGAPAGITLAVGGTVTNGAKNNSTASISGNTGIVFNGSGIVVNYGTITGTGGTAISFTNGAPNNRLVQQATGVINGIVNGGGGTLELAGLLGPGTVNGLGTNFKGFSVVKINAGATWTLGTAWTMAATTKLDNFGICNLPVQITNNGQVVNEASGVIDLQGDVGIAKTGAITNLGLIKKTAGTGVSILRADTGGIIDSGVIDVQTGTIELVGNSVSVTGLIKGAGTIEFGPGVSTIGTGASLAVANLLLAGTGAQLVVARNLGYAGGFTAGSNTEVTLTAGNNLALNGPASFNKSAVDGAARLTTSGATSANGVTLGGTAQWYNGGTLTATGDLTIGDSLSNAATFRNLAGGVLDLHGTIDIQIGSSSASTLANLGTILKSMGGLSLFGPTLANTGLVEVASGALELQAAVTGNGTFKIDAGKILQFDSSVGSGQTVIFNQGGDKLVLTDAANFSGKLSGFTLGDKLDLRQFNPATTTLAFKENAAMTQGVLTVTDGGLQAKIVLLGQYAAGQFHISSDGLGGSYITDPPLHQMTLFAAGHG